ncbi:MAG TPA: N-acetylmuramoyl-L-alanine amidase [Lachnospiraceae bacterium]|nr:N-acetylmuramoyl-L-alanine amidase [Lachnospiraceae bacterium]
MKGKGKVALLLSLLIFCVVGTFIYFQHKVSKDTGTPVIALATENEDSMNQKELTSSSNEDQAVSTLGKDTEMKSTVDQSTTSKESTNVDKNADTKVDGQGQRDSSLPESQQDSDKTSKDEEKTYTIVIDAGHQRVQNKEEEPIGPGASETKPKVSSGTQGKYTGKPEYEVNLEVSLKLEDILEKQGYKVVMVRESHDVNISNSERAKVANDSKADVFVRIHCNGSEDSSTNGILTMCQTKSNPYCGEYYEQSRALSESILNNLCTETGANNQGVVETDTMSGINWCQVPVTIVEMGFMTNENEDQSLSSEEYQNKLANGIAVGITEYLTSR